MAFYSIEDVTPNMVLAHDILSNDRRILLRAGIKLSAKHINALKALGFKHLEISTNRYQYEETPEVHIEHEAHAKPRDITPEKVEAVVKTLEVKLPPSKPLKSDPMLETRSEAVAMELLKTIQNPRIEQNMNIADVIKRAASRVIAANEGNEEERRAKAKESGLSEGMAALVSEHISN
jgi:hypothetical protein